jgi:hypothetical protein
MGIKKTRSVERKSLIILIETDQLVVVLPLPLDRLIKLIYEQYDLAAVLAHLEKPKRAFHLPKPEEESQFA